MKAVLHLPVAEQYPSRTATVDSFASKRTSGMSRRLLLGRRVISDKSFDERFKSFPCGKWQVGLSTIEQTADCWLIDSCAGFNLLLRKTKRYRLLE